MARFDVFLPRRGMLLMDVQADRMREISTRIVVPLIRVENGHVHDGYSPVFEIAGVARAMATHLLFSTQARRLGAPLGNLAQHRDDITRALDLLFTGF